MSGEEGLGEPGYARSREPEGADPGYASSPGPGGADPGYAGSPEPGGADPGAAGPGGAERGGARDTIYIGKKPLMAYVTSTLIQLATLPSVTIKARGRSIGYAVDVSQIILRKTDAEYSIGGVRIGSEPLESQDGKTRNVSTIEIELRRQG